MSTILSGNQRMRCRNAGLCVQCPVQRHTKHNQKLAHLDHILIVRCFFIRYCAAAQMQVLKRPEVCVQLVEAAIFVLNTSQAPSAFCRMHDKSPLVAYRAGESKEGRLTALSLLLVPSALRAED